MSYENEFDNFNTMMLEDYPLRFDEVDQIDPTQFRERVAELITKAKNKLSFAGITQKERLGLMNIASKGLEAMRYNSHDALVDFYKTTYMNEINKATESDYFVAKDFDYIGDNENEVIIHEQEIVEGIEQFSAFDPAWNVPSFREDGRVSLGSLADVESFWTKNKTYLILGAVAIGAFAYSKKRKRT